MEIFFIFSFLRATYHGRREKSKTAFVWENNFIEFLFFLNFHFDVDICNGSGVLNLCLVEKCREHFFQVTFQMPILIYFLVYEENFLLSADYDFKWAEKRRAKIIFLP